MSNKKFYITTSIAYANAAPHIGYAMEVLQADVLARYHRMCGNDVFFLSGMDENGSKVKKTAQEKEINVQEFVDENSARFELLLDTLNVSNNDFIRTTDKIRHWPSAQKMWTELVKAGDIYKDNYEGCYCVGCEAYLTEKDLVDGQCPNHQKAPEKIQEENYFFKLSKYSKKIQEKIESGELKILPESRKNEILNVIKSGLKDISFSRPKKVLDWGVPVPDDKSQTMYVWCDALTNYISALEYAKDSEKFQKYWPADVHIIGKDILRFHAAIWPGMLMSAGLPLPKKILVHGFITSEGQKMSKSLGNVIDPFEIIDKYGVDALRHYLLREIPSSGDGDFSYERFEEVYQADLANGIGNLVARVMALATISNFQFPISNQSPIFNLQISKTWKKYESFIENFKLNESLNTVWKFISICDEYIEKNKPWQLDGKEKEEVIYNLIESLRHIAWMIWPFMPETANKIFAQLLADEKERKKELSKNLKQAQEWGGLKSGMKIKKKENLFPRL
jgi:methionyl-tRNA synthetase